MFHPKFLAQISANFCLNYFSKKESNMLRQPSFFKLAGSRDIKTTYRTVSKPERALDLL